MSVIPRVVIHPVIYKAIEEKANPNLEIFYFFLCVLHYKQYQNIYLYIAVIYSKYW